uniref:Ig-like domain-containing protein n=1 Tax=Periophthalmus magnuspinnatus TaxID=409849 RepID=A0A3B3Z899_9GOBI
FNLNVKSCYFECTGRATGRDVTQSDMLRIGEGETTTMDCSHTKGTSYFQMYWYRQRPGENMRQIVFTTPSSTPDFEPDFKNKRFKVTKPNAESGTLTVENLEPGDSGVYFCAFLHCTAKMTMTLENSTRR